MIAQPQHLKMSVEAYLALDRESQDVRYEYIDGYAYLLAGGTPIHALIAVAHVEYILQMPKYAYRKNVMFSQISR